MAGNRGGSANMKESEKPSPLPANVLRHKVG